MSFEKSTNERGRAVFTDNKRSIKFEESVGRLGEGFIYDLSYKGPNVRIKVEYEDIHLFEVSSFWEFPEDLESEREEVIELIKEFFDFYMKWKSEKANADYQVIYSI